MATYIIEVEVDEDSLLNNHLELRNIKPEEFDGTIESIIDAEMGWVHGSGIIVNSVKMKKDE